jgi:hypothetical protein
MRGARNEITEPTLQQEAEGIRPRAIWWVGIGIVAIGAALVLIAWWLVAPPASFEPAARASTLQHGLIEHASGGPDLHAAGAQALERTQWVDRKAGTVRIPIDRAIDAVVANPKLIGARPAAASGTRAVLDAPAPSASRIATPSAISPSAPPIATPPAPPIATPIATPPATPIAPPPATPGEAAQ